MSQAGHEAERGRRLRALFCTEPRRTLAVAESLTCGRVQAAIGATSGASDFFLGGITAYSLAGKEALLGVDPGEAARTSAVSPAVAAGMAAGACRLFRSDVGVATTGYAEPDLARGIANPMAFWAIAARGPSGEIGVVREGRLEFPGLGRVAAQEAVAERVVDELVAWADACRRGG